MHWIGILSFVGAAVVSVRWMLTRVDTLGRRKPFPMFWVGMLIVLVGMLFHFRNTLNHSRQLQLRLSA